MKSLALFAAAIALSAAAPASSPLEQGFAGALKGCEEWVLNPASWANGTKPFVEAIGLGESMVLIDAVPDVALPPQKMRAANHSWRINTTTDAGYFLVVSDVLPMCHITGGGQADLQPAVEHVLTSPSFAERWEKIEVVSTGDMVSTHYRHRKFREFEIVVSRAESPGLRTDRVQLLATAGLELTK